MKKLLVRLSLIFLALFTLVSPTQAQEDATNSPTLKKYNIVFPISELGNCNSLTECRSFCEDKTNQSACIEFAKKKAFYNPQSAQKKKTDFLEKAKKELGCNSGDSC